MTTKPGTSNGKEVGPRLCARCHITEARPNQRYCLGCHAAANRVYRVRLKRDHAGLLATVADLSGDNQETREKFVNQVGTSRVLVFKKGGDCIEYSATVIGYLPQEKLSVRSESGKIAVVDLSQVQADYNPWYE